MTCGDQGGVETERRVLGERASQRKSTFPGAQCGVRGAGEGRGPGGEGHVPRATTAGCEDPGRLAQHAPSPRM